MLRLLALLMISRGDVSILPGMPSATLMAASFYASAAHSGLFIYADFAMPRILLRDYESGPAVLGMLEANATVASNYFAHDELALHLRADGRFPVRPSRMPMPASRPRTSAVDRRASQAAHVAFAADARKWAPR